MSSSRREMLESLAARAAAVPGAALGESGIERPGQGPDAAKPCARPRSGPHAGYIPNVVVHTHQNQRALFYDDLLAGRTVMINFMSIAGQAAHPLMENLVRVQRLLGASAGRDFHMYSLTVDPRRDTPRALRRFAEKLGVGPGWLLLTGAPEDMELLRGKLFSQTGGHRHGAGRPAEDCSQGLIRYGNEAAGVWGAVPAKTDPEWIVRRLLWVQTRKPPAGPSRRGGPFPPATG